MQIIIQPIENDINTNILNLLSDSLSVEFNNNVIVAPTLKIDIQNFINKSRNQLRSADLLNWVLERIKPTKNEMKILSICDRDAYSGNLNFVFGEASSLGGQVATIYLPRLRPEFYGLASDDQVFNDRIVKEAIHELGHTFGLIHCKNKRCVMHFSNSLHDTDFKNRTFCENCKNKLWTIQV